jgi:hypothetical protein
MLGALSAMDSQPNIPILTKSDLICILKTMKLCLRFCFFLLTWWTSANAATVENIPVNYGGDENTDACSTLALVANLSAGENEFLTESSLFLYAAKGRDLA